MKYCLTDVTVANDGLTLSLLIIVLSWLRMGEHKSTKKKKRERNEIKHQKTVAVVSVGFVSA